MESFHLEVYTGRGLEFSEEVTEVVLPSVDGKTGFLPLHADYVGNLGSGVLEYFSQQHKLARRSAISGGFCRFSNNTLQVVTDTVDTTETVNEASILKQKQELESELALASEFDADWSYKTTRLARLKAIYELLEQ